jgi:hypothetical protein
MGDKQKKQQHKRKTFTCNPYNPLAKQSRKQPTIPGIWNGIQNPLR